MHTVGDVIDEARDVMREFDLEFLPDNEALYPVLTRQERALLPQLVQVARSGFEFPNDSSAAVDISAWSRSYALPAEFWRHRHTEVTYAAGGVMPVQVVSSSWEKSLPPVEPAMFLRGGEFYPIDGVRDGSASSRSLGWSDADSVSIEFIPNPTDKSDDSDPLDAPVEAVRYLGYALAAFMATRGKAAQSTVQQIRADKSDAFEQLVADVQSFPGAEHAQTR